MCGGGSEFPVGLLTGLCGRTRLAYKAHFGREVSADNEAWFFYGPDLVRCYFPSYTGKLTSQVVRTSPDATVADLLDSLDIPAGDRKGLTPQNARRTTHIRDVPFHAYASIIFLGPADVKRRERTWGFLGARRRITTIQIKSVTGKPFRVMIDLAFDEGDLVFELKEILHDRTGVKPCEQRLTFNGRELQDSWRLRDAGIWSLSVIHLLREPCGC
jgi:hypothetical protein